MTNDQEALAQRVAEQRVELAALLLKLPQGMADASSTRVQAWKAAHAAASQVFSRNPAAVAPYVEAINRLKSCVTADVALLAKEMWNDK